MIDLPLQQGVHKVELERDHLRAEAERVKVVLPRARADGGGAVGRKLPRVQEALERRRVRERDVGRRHFRRERRRAAGSDALYVTPPTVKVPHNHRPHAAAGARVE